MADLLMWFMIGAAGGSFCVLLWRWTVFVLRDCHDENYEGFTVWAFVMLLIVSLMWNAAGLPPLLPDDLFSGSGYSDRSSRYDP